MATVAVYCLCGKPYDPLKFMIQCDACKDWFHTSCIGLHEHQSSQIEKYHCPKCEKMFGPSISKSRTNWHRHNTTEEGADKKAVQTGTPVFIKELKIRHFPSADDVIHIMRGQQLSLPFLIEKGFELPILVNDLDGLELVVPPATFEVGDLKQYFDPDFEIDAIDVTSQEDVKMTLHDFVKYYNSPSRSAVLNLISLEFSNSRMSSLVEPPYVVNKLSWIHNLWPEKLPEDCPFTKPNVHKYCLIGVRNSFTDFHIDFGGTSVWYHVLKGEKVFFLIRPTPANLALYKRWMASSNRSETFFGDQVDACYRCVLQQGSTLLIPTGWIHAVLTPVDSLVFGGNFLHSLQIPLQLQVYEIERQIRTPSKYRFPHFEACNWFAAKHLLSELKDSCGKQFPHIVQGAKALVSALKSWTQEKEHLKTHRDEIPSTIQFPKLIRELAKEVRQVEKVISCKKSKLRLLPPRDKRGRMAIRLGSSPTEVKLPVSKSSSVEHHGNKFKIEKSIGSSGNAKATIQMAKPMQDLKRNNTTKNSDASVYDFCESDNDSLDVDVNSSSSSKRLSGRALKCRRRPSPIKLKLSFAGKQLTETTNKAFSSGSTDVLPADLQIAPASPKLAGIEELLRASRYSADNTLRMQPGGRVSNPSDLKPIISVTKNVTSDKSASVIMDGENSSSTYQVSPSGRASPSTCEAIQGMLSIGQDIQFAPSTVTPTPKSYTVDGVSCSVLDKASCQVNPQFHIMKTIPSESSIGHDMESKLRTATISDSNTKLNKRKIQPKRTVADDELLSGCHEDNDFVYPSLVDVSDEEMSAFSSKRRDAQDDTWIPKARHVPKSAASIRDNISSDANESCIPAAATKPVHQPAKKRTYKRKSTTVKKNLCIELEIESPTFGDKESFQNKDFQSSCSAALKAKKIKRGFATTKQRLGRILKIHKMLY